jgi:hypothetical protein
MKDIRHRERVNALVTIFTLLLLLYRRTLSKNLGEKQKVTPFETTIVYLCLKKYYLYARYYYL